MILVMYCQTFFHTACLVHSARECGWAGRVVVHGCSARGHAWPRGAGDDGGGSGEAQQSLEKSNWGVRVESHMSNLAWLIPQVDGRRGPMEPGEDTAPSVHLNHWHFIRSTDCSATDQPSNPYTGVTQEVLTQTVSRWTDLGSLSVIINNNRNSL